MLIEKNRVLIGEDAEKALYKNFHCKTGCSNCKYITDDDIDINLKIYYQDYEGCRQLYFDTHYILIDIRYIYTSLEETNEYSKILIKDKISLEEWKALIDIKNNACQKANNVCLDCEFGRRKTSISIDTGKERRDDEVINISRFISCIDYYRLTRKENMSAKGDYLR